jgi:hypothetical protein
MTIRTILPFLFIVLLLASGCGKQVVPNEVGPPGTQQPPQKESKSYLRDEAQLRKLIEQAKEKNLRVPSGTYATYGYILLQKKNYPEAVHSFELEMEIYPTSRPQMKKLIQAAKRRQWLEQEIVKKKTGSATPTPPKAEAAPKAQSASPEEVIVRETIILAETPPEASPAPSAAQPATQAKPSATGKQAVVSPYSTLEEVLAFPADDGLVVALHLIGEIGEVKHFALRDPLRYVVDVFGRWRVKSPKEIEVNSGKVKRIRIGEYPDKVRVVVDLSAYPDSVSDPVKSPDWLSITVR